MVGSLDELAYVTMKMKPGECLKLDRHTIRRISPDNWLTGEPGIDRLKSNIVGAAYDWRFDVDPLNGSLTMCRVQGDGKRRHVDYDRRHLFIENADGTFDLTRK